MARARTSAPVRSLAAALGPVLTLVSTLALAPAPAVAGSHEAAPLVAVTAIVRNAAIDATVTGITDALRDAGYRAGDTVRVEFESAEADASRARDLVQGFAAEKAAAIVALTEPSARIAAGEKLRSPLIVAGIGDATASDIRRNHAARLVTGIIDGERFDAPLALIREMAPGAVSVAVPVNADLSGSDGPDKDGPDKDGADNDGAAANAADALRAMTAFARTLDLTIEELPVSLANNAIAATIEGYAPADTVLLLDRRVFPDAPVEAILAAAEDAGLAVFASDEDAVVRGALAAIVADPYGTGRQIGDLVARILRSPSAARAPIVPAEPSYVIVNRDAAAQVGLEISPALLKRRVRQIGWAADNAPRPRGKPLVPETRPADDRDSGATGDAVGGADAEDTN
jgi:putative ABC transport system substrate-binding protein